MNIKDEIKKTISSFEAHNNINIDWYHSNPPGIMNVFEDKRIGADVFEQRIEEWLLVCTTEEEKRLLLKLLASFDYYPQNAYSYYLNELITSYFEKINFRLGIDNIEDILILAVPNLGMQICGATHITSLIGCKLLEYGAKDQIITNFIYAEDMQEKIDKCKHIALIDDILGSGCTLNTALSALFDTYNINTNVDINILLMCGRGNKIRKKMKDFKTEYSNYNIGYILQKEVYKCNSGVTQVVSDDELAIIKDLEIRIEKSLPSSSKSYVLGFDHNSLLVSFFYNTPNNSLSSFWRATPNNIPIFTRADKPHRLSIPELQDITENNTKNAYRNHCKS